MQVQDIGPSESNGVRVDERFGWMKTVGVPAHLVGCRVTVTVQEGEVVLAVAGVEVARHGLVAPGEVASRMLWDMVRYRPV